jgi:hypothetical protein
MSTGGYWTSTSTVNLKANLYVKGSKDALWTSNISVTDPTYVDQVANTLGGYIYGDWKKDNILKGVTSGK